MEITLPELMEVINRVREKRQNLFAIIREHVQKTLEHYLTYVWRMKPSHFGGKVRYVMKTLHAFRPLPGQQACIKYQK